VEAAEVALEAEAVGVRLAEVARRDRHQMQAGRVQLQGAVRLLALQRSVATFRVHQFFPWEIQSRQSCPMEVLLQLADWEIPHR
jgi:hypothetical protein